MQAEEQIRHRLERLKEFAALGEPDEAPCLRHCPNLPNAITAGALTALSWVVGDDDCDFDTLLAALGQSLATHHRPPVKPGESTP